MNLFYNCRYDRSTLKKGSWMGSYCQLGMALPLVGKPVFCGDRAFSAEVASSAPPKGQRI